MNACQDEDDCPTPTRCKHLDRCPNAAPAEVSPERPVQLGALGVGTGSLPGFDAEALAKLWEDSASALRMNARRQYHTHATISRVYAKADQLEECAKELRLLMAATNQRQPEENVKDQPRLCLARHVRQHGA